MRTKGNSHNKFMRFIILPFKALVKAKDLYVRSMTSCASRVSYGQSSGGRMGQYPDLPRSFSASTVGSSDDNEDLRELIRAASARSLGYGNELEMLLQQRLGVNMRSSKALPKSCSVGMGRIDEEKSCEFEENDVVVIDKKRDLLYPRSKSYAVTKTSPSFDSY